MPLRPHAFHLNLPNHHIDEDGVPFITKFAQDKARTILRLAHSIQLKEALFFSDDSTMEDQVDDDEADEYNDEDHALPSDSTLVSFPCRALGVPLRCCSQSHLTFFEPKP